MNDFEKNFCEFWEDIIIKKNRYHASTQEISNAETLLGVEHQDTTCSSCLHNAAIELNNKFNAMLDTWNLYKENKILEQQKLEAKLKESRKEEPILKTIKPIKKAGI